jgi:hypothetical protein
MGELVTEEDLARARADTKFRHKLMATNLDRLLDRLNTLRRAKKPSPKDVRQLREGVELAVKLADRLQSAAKPEPPDDPEPPQAA